MLKLTEIAYIMPGYPFRGAIQTDDAADVFVLQARNIDFQSSWMELNSFLLDKTRLKGRRIPNYVHPNDIVFLARGRNNYSVCINRVAGKTVCTPHFFHIRIRESYQRSLLPTFLSWQINRNPAQSYFARCSQGSVVPNVSKQQLAKLPVVIPPLGQQRHVVNLAKVIQQEQQLYQKLMRNRVQLEQAISQDILNFQRTGSIYE